MLIDRKLADKFELEAPAPLPSAVAIIAPAPIVVSDIPGDEIDVDSAKARTTLNNLIDKSVLALEDLIHVARESENPRAYEVVAQMIKATADISKDLLAIQKAKRELHPADDDSPTLRPNIQNQQNIFVGSTDELLRTMKSLQPALQQELPAQAEVIIRQ